MANCVQLKARHLIVTADDLGLTPRVNDAIEKAHRDGIVTTASLMANGGAFDSAAAMLKRNAKLAAGLHLNLTEGIPVSLPDRIPSLAGSRGFIFRHPLDLAAAWFRGRVHSGEVEREMRAQIEKVLNAGVSLSHIDGHKHVHVIPAVLRLVSRIAPDYGIRAVRSTVEKSPGLKPLLSRNPAARIQILKQFVFGKVVSAAFRWTKPALRTPAEFYGVTQTGFLDFEAFSDIIRTLGSGFHEVMCHPGYVDEDLLKTPTRLRAQRERELELLTSPRLRDLIESEGVTLISYRDLVTG